MKFSKKLTREFAQTVIKYGLIEQGDRILVGFSGGKDSFSLVYLMDRMQKIGIKDFTFLPVCVAYADENLQAQVDNLRSNSIPCELIRSDILQKSKEQMRENSSACSYFSRQRRGELYLYAKKHGFNKVALGHHLDDAAQSFFMNMFQNGKLRSMPPKYTTNDNALIVIRPLIQTREEKLRYFATSNALPTIANEFCPAFRSAKLPYMREEIRQLLQELSTKKENLFTMLKSSLSNIDPSSFADDRYL